MKKLTFKKNTILELNDDKLKHINGGTLPTNPDHEAVFISFTSFSIGNPLPPLPISDTTTSGPFCTNATG